MPPRKHQLPNLKKTRVEPPRVEATTPPEKEPRLTSEQRHILSSRFFIEDLFLAETPTNDQIVLPHPYFIEHGQGPDTRRVIQATQNSEGKMQYNISRSLAEDEAPGEFEIENIPGFETQDIHDFLNYLGNQEFVRRIIQRPDLIKFLSLVSEHAATIDILANEVEVRHFLHLQRSVLEFTIFDLWRNLIPERMQPLPKLEKPDELIKPADFLVYYGQIAVFAQLGAKYFLEDFPEISNTLGKSEETITLELSEYLAFEYLIDEGVDIPNFFVQNSPDAISRILATRTAYIQAGYQTKETEDYQYLRFGIHAELPPTRIEADKEIDDTLAPGTPILSQEYSNVLALYQDQILARYYPRTMSAVEQHLTDLTDYSDYHLRRCVIARQQDSLKQLGVTSLNQIVAEDGRAWVKQSVKSNFSIANKAVRRSGVKPWVKVKDPALVPVAFMETALMSQDVETGQTQPGYSNYIQDFPPEMRSVAIQFMNVLALKFVMSFQEVNDIVRSRIGLELGDFNQVIQELLKHPSPESFNAQIAIHAYNQQGEMLGQFGQRLNFYEFFQENPNPGLRFENYVAGIRKRIEDSGISDPTIYAAVHINHDQFAQEQITLQQFISSNWQVEPLYKRSR